MSRHAVSTRAVLAAAIGLVALVMGAGSAMAAPSNQDSDWMVAAHQSNLTEIAAGQAAQQKATSQQIKDLGAMFVQMHTQLDADLTAAAQSLGVSLPGSPNPTQQATLASVGAKSGAAFDPAWTTSQITGHRQALAATDKEISSGSDATVVKLATAAKPVIQQHLTALLALPQAPSSVQAGSGGQVAQAADARTPWLVALAALGAVLIGLAVLPSARRRVRG